MIKGKVISVIGAGTAGCFTTLHLARKYPDVKIVWVVKSLTNNIGVGEASVPVVQDFLTDLGYDVNYILNKCNGSLKLGIKFKNFSKFDFWHPFGNNSQEQQDILYMSQKNRITDHVLEYRDIATHFDVNILIKDFYKKIALCKNVTITDKIPEHDIKIMCTGFNEYNSREYVTTSKLPNNTALVYRSNYSNKNKMEPYTVCTGMNNGWMWKISLKDCASYGYVNSGDSNSLEEFITFLSDRGVDVDSNKIRKISFHSGRRKEHLICEKITKCYIGLSSCFIEPLESTGMYFIVNSIKMLCDYFDGKINARQYNDIINHDYDTVYNFIVAHYTQSSNNNEYWSQFKNIKYEILTNNLFPDSSWNYILNGLKEGTPNAIPVSNYKQLSTGKPYTDWYNKKYICATH